MRTPVTRSTWTLSLFCLCLLAFPHSAPGQAGGESNCLAMMPEEAELVATPGAVLFPHQLHVDLEISCQECHHETLASELQMPHPEYFVDFWIECATCHRSGSTASCPQKCSVCHHSSPTHIADETLSSKVVLHQGCWDCHPVGTGPEASQSCENCHQPGHEGSEG